MCQNQSVPFSLESCFEKSTIAQLKAYQIKLFGAFYHSMAESSGFSVSECSIFEGVEVAKPNNGEDARELSENALKAIRLTSGCSRSQIFSSLTLCLSGILVSRLLR